MEIEHILCMKSLCENEERMSKSDERQFGQNEEHRGQRFQLSGSDKRKVGKKRMWGQNFQVRWKEMMSKLGCEVKILGQIKEHTNETRIRTAMMWKNMTMHAR